MQVTVPISVGELLDKITILEIKAERIGDPAKRANVARELAELGACRDTLGLKGDDLHRLVGELGQVNRRLWDVEDDLRRLEQQQSFGADFVRLARSVYLENDRRAEIKREINRITGSSLVEEKSYSGG
jgi:type II secretory pathway predicted ATPase ExeA